MGIAVPWLSTAALSWFYVTFLVPRALGGGLALVAAVLLGVVLLSFLMAAAAITRDAVRGVDSGPSNP